MAKDLMVLEQKQISDALASEELCDALLEEISKHAKSFAFDLSKAKGRKDCISHAADVKRTGKALIEAADDEIQKRKDDIDAFKSFKIKVKDYLADLSAEIRKPVTEIEEKEKLEKEKEKKRLSAIEEKIHGLGEIGPVDLTVATVEELEAGLKGISTAFFEITKDVYEEFYDAAKEVLASRENDLENMLTFRKEQDALDAEKKKLAEEQERIEKEKAELKAKEDARLKRIDSAIQRIKDCDWPYDKWVNAPLVKDKIKTLESIVIDESYEERFKEAETLKEEILHKLAEGWPLAAAADAEAEKKLKAAEKKKAEEAAAEKKQKEELKEKERKAAEVLKREAREANIEHRRTINRKVIEIIQSAGVSEEKAISVLKAIITADSEHITVNY